MTGPVFYVNLPGCRKVAGLSLCFTSRRSFGVALIGWAACLEEDLPGSILLRRSPSHRMVHVMPFAHRNLTGLYRLRHFGSLSTER